MDTVVQLRMGHRRLASVVARALPDGKPVDVAISWRDPTSVNIALGDVDDTLRAVASVAAALRHAHAEGAEYAVAQVSPERAGTIRCLLRVGFEPELTEPGQEAAWKRLLATESGRQRLL